MPLPDTKNSLYFNILVSNIQMTSEVLIGLLGR